MERTSVFLASIARNLAGGPLLNLRAFGLGPRHIGQVYEEVGPAEREFPAQIGVRVLEANRCPKADRAPSRRQVEDHISRSRGPAAFEPHDLLDEVPEPRIFHKRNRLGKGHQVDLRVALDQIGLRIDEDDRIRSIVRLPIDHDGRAGQASHVPDSLMNGMRRGT